MRMRQSFVRLLTALIAPAALLPAAWAADLGALVGRVTTAARAPVAYATVTATRPDGGAIRATLSGSDACANEGGIWFPDLRSREVTWGAGVMVKF